jgi:hypothetical protein
MLLNGLMPFYPAYVKIHAFDDTPMGSYLLTTIVGVGIIVFGLTVLLRLSLSFTLWLGSTLVVINIVLFCVGWVRYRRRMFDQQSEPVSLDNEQPMSQRKAPARQHDPQLRLSQCVSRCCATMHWAWHVVILWSILGFVWFTGLAWYLGEPIYALIFLVFTIFAIYSLQTIYTTTCVDTIGITVTTMTATYTLAWDDITYVETNPSDESGIGNTLVFCGGTKAIVVSLVGLNKAGRQLRQLLSEHIAHRKIVVQPLNNIAPQHRQTKQSR